MTPSFEQINYSDDDRIAILESRAAELERQLLAVMHPGGLPGWGNVATPDDAYPEETGPGAVYGESETGAAGLGDTGLDDGEFGDAGLDDGEFVDAGLGDGDGRDGGYRGRGERASRTGGRTEALINRGRPRARRSRGRRVLAHWRLLAVCAAALLAVAGAALMVTGGPGPGWPASVATVQAEVKQACANPDVAAEPGGLDFACAKDTQPVLWVFALLTSGDNPGFVDQSTGRRGLEPIQPAQGGDIAWSLNLHHPYNAADALDSLMVAARAINNIVYGATLTSANGGALVEPGLEGKAANCQRYTGSPRLVTRAGYPARCAAPVGGGSGQAALVSDVFQQWMGGTPSRIAGEAGVLFENAGNPGDPRVQAILASLPASGG